MTMRRGAAGVLVVLLALAALLALGASPAAADGITIRKVDTTQFPKVTVSALVSGRNPEPGDFHLRENGKILNQFDVVPIAKTNTPVGIVMVIDVSGSMTQNDKMGQAKAAAKQFVAAKQPTDQIAIEVFSDQPRLAQGFTADAAQLNQAIDGLAPRGETALWDGVRAGTDLFRDRPDLQPNVVVLSDGADTVSVGTAGQARAAAIGTHATVFAIGLEGGDFAGGPLEGLADATGGSYQATSDPKTLAGMYGSVQRSLQNQYEITYTSKASGTIGLDLSAAGYSQSARGINTGTVSQGVATNPDVVESRTPGFLKGPLGPYVIAALVMAAVGLLAFGIVLTVVRDRSSLQSALSPYDMEGGQAPEDGGNAVSFAETAFVQRAVAVTARLAEERGILQRLEAMLERADLPLRSAEALFFYLAGIVVLTLMSLIITRSWLGGLVALIAVALVPIATLKLLAGKRRRKFTSLLPDTLQLLSGSLRAGYSLLQGVEAVSQEVEEPMGKELRRVLAEARLGRPLEDSLEDTAERMGSGDFAWAVMAIRIQREVGGNLAELLQTVGETMIARERLRREVSALTAEGRISAIVLGILPVGLGGAMWVINPTYMRVLFEDTVGQAMLGGAILLAIAGFFWMKKVIQIDI